MSTHTIKWVRTGWHDSVGDWEDEQEITFSTEQGDSFGHPILHFVSISPGAGDHGAFSDIAQAHLESDAADWLDGDGYDAACALATSKSDVPREIEQAAKPKPYRNQEA